MDATREMALEGWKRELEESGDYVVLKRFKPIAPFVYGPGVHLEDCNRGLFIDFETTGTDANTDKPIALAAAPFAFDGGRIEWTESPYVGFEDPGMPIPPEVTTLTGITDDMVRGKRFDDDHVNRLAGPGADLIVAYNAGFDRRIAERRFPAGFIGAAFGCAMREVPWEKITGSLSWPKLDYLMYKALRLCHDAHSPLDDCLGAIHLLQGAQIDGKPAFAHLIESVKQATVRVWATGAPFDVKDKLKAKRYEWSDGVTRSRKGWFKDVKPPQVNDEVAFLNSLYGPTSPTFERFGARDRYSIRA